ncbi:MAG: MucB/RseB C-terminal domain-containing protein [Gammaproteobacteria bacterium]|nr:MucB/RseB C-terminal domain-containing protein [Gammaproteobacteria bacterium]
MEKDESKAWSPKKEALMTGTVNAYGTIIGSYFVTVVGEVPALTVEKIGTAINYIED